MDMRLSEAGRHPFVAYQLHTESECIRCFRAEIARDFGVGNGTRGAHCQIN